MRKMIGILIMVIVIAVYVIAMIGKTSNDKSSANKEKTTSVSSDQKIAQIEEKIDTAYPEKPAEIVTLHNELMKIFYSQLSTSESLEDYARTIRKIYSKEFQNLNSLEAQVEELETEKEYIKSINITLVASEIKEVYISKDKEGHEDKAEVNVAHATNQGMLYRTYFLINEDGAWKINAWKNQVVDNTNGAEDTTSAKEIKSEG